MARAFNVDAARSTFELPPHTRQQIQALMLDLNLDARDVIIRATSELWQHEIGEPPRDLTAEIDELRSEIEQLKRG